MEGALIGQYLKKVRGVGAAWERLPYSGTFDWERDSDLSDSDLEDEESQSNNESNDEEGSTDDSDVDISRESAEEVDTGLGMGADETE